MTGPWTKTETMAGLFMGETSLLLESLPQQCLNIASD